MHLSRSVLFTPQHNIVINNLLILGNITLSSSLLISITSINAIGLVLLMSYSPASDFGRGLSTVLFHVAGTCSPRIITLFIDAAILSRFSSLITLTIYIVIPDLFDLNFFISSLRSSTLTPCITESHILCSACFCSKCLCDRRYATSMNSFVSGSVIWLVSSRPGYWQS